MFCLLCNSEEKLYDGLCKNCYLKEFEIIKVPKYATFTVCSHCGATLKHEKWIESAYYDDEIINDAIRKDIEVNDKIEDLSISTSILNNRGTMYDCVIHASGNIISEHIEKEYPIEVKVEKGVCPDCSKFYSGYYEAVIQLRADGRKLEEEEIRLVDEFISNEIQRLCKTNKLAYVSERIELKEGVDYQVGSSNVAFKIADGIQKHFGGFITESRKIVGHDKSRSRDLYRSWISVRLPSFQKDDFIKYDEKIMQIKKIGSHKFACLNLEDYTSESISWKEYDKTSKVAEISDVKKSMVTNVTPKIIQILDPDTYSTIEFKKHEKHENINIGEEIDIIKIEEKIYVIV